MNISYEDFDSVMQVRPTLFTQFTQFTPQPPPTPHAGGARGVDNDHDGCWRALPSAPPIVAGRAACAMMMGVIAIGGGVGRCRTQREPELRTGMMRVLMDRLFDSYQRLNAVQKMQGRVAYFREFRKVRPPAHCSRSQRPLSIHTQHKGTCATACARGPVLPRRQRGCPPSDGGACVCWQELRLDVRNIRLASTKPQEYKSFVEDDPDEAEEEENEFVPAI
jgi:hypothetical protein